MKFYQVTLISKNKSSLENSFFFNNSVFNSIVKKKIFNKKKKIKKLTILKSPHVNKTAQEQFESRNFSRQLNLLCLSNSLKYLISSKKIGNILFPDIFFKTQFFVNKQTENSLKLKVFNPNNFKITTNFNISQIVVLKNKKVKTIYYYEKVFKFSHVYRTNMTLIKIKKFYKKIKYFVKTFDAYGEFKNFSYV